jgi:molecular chaperone GrpE
LTEGDLPEVAERLDELTDLFRRRLLDDRDKRRAIDALEQRLEELEPLARGEAAVPLAREMLPLVDRLDGYDGPDASVVSSVVDELLVALARCGIEEIAVDSEFDPRQQEAVEHVGTDDDGSLRVAEVRRRGFRTPYRVLRPSQVVVAGTPDSGIAG